MITMHEQMGNLENAMQKLVATVEKNSAETSAALKETSAVVKETSAVVKKTSAVVERTSAFVEKMLAKIDATNDRMDARQAQLSKDMRASSAKADRTVGEMANKMGTLVEDIVSPGIATMFQQQFGRELLPYPGPRVRRIHRHDAGRMREFDYVAMDADVMLVTETKSKLRPENIPEFIGVLQEIRDYLFEADGRMVFGCLASFSLDPSLVIAGERQGLLMVGLGTGLMRVLNSPGFSPREF
jgi:hypothetical protein